jgi:hypothetical protein
MFIHLKEVNINDRYIYIRYLSRDTSMSSNVIEVK